MLILVSVLNPTGSKAQGTDETVHVKIPGTLSELVLDLESSRINSLTITGQLSAPDIAFLNSGTGKLASTTKLDISAVTLVPGDEPYTTVEIAKSDVGMGKTTATYYISDEYKTESNSDPTGLGGYNVTMKVWCNDLSGAFALPKPSATLPAYTEIILPNSLPKVGEYIFTNNSSIRKVILPENIQSISEGAFFNTKALEYCNLPSSLISIGSSSFEYSSISSLVFPASLREIGNLAFSNSKLTCSLDFSNVEKIGERAFQNVKITGELNLVNLEEVPDYAFEKGFYESALFSDKLKYIGSEAFSNSKLENIVLPTSLINLYASAFKNTPWLNSLTDENGIIYINDIALMPTANYDKTENILKFKEGTRAIASGSWDVYLVTGKGYLKEFISGVEFPATLKEIGDGVFENFSNIGDIDLPENMERIGNNAFNRCSNLWFKDLPTSIINIGKGAFNECSKLTNITLGENVRTVGSGAFYKCTGITLVKVYAKELVDSENINLGNSGLDKIIIGKDVKVLPGGMFMNAANLRKVEFEERSLADPLIIGESCFAYDKNAQFINFPQRIDSIGEDGFNNCRNLSEDIVLRYCKYIGKYAFSFCTAIESLTLPEKLEYIEDDSFSYCNIKAVNYNCIAAKTGGTPFRENESISVINISPETTLLDRNIFSNIYSEFTINFLTGSDTRSGKSLEIGAFAFSSSKLKEITLPDYTVKIGDRAFSYTSLKRLDIPASVNYLGEYLINYSSIADLYIHALTPPELAGRLVENYPPNIYVPGESIELYKEAPFWSLYNLNSINVSVESISLSPESWPGIAGESFTIDAMILPENATDKTLTWSSSDESIATVDDNGNVTIIKSGNCDIIAKSNDNPEIEARCHITGTTDVDNINADSNEIIYIYSIAGILIGKTENIDNLKDLQQGEYITHRGGETRKIIIK